MGMFGLLRSPNSSISWTELVLSAVLYHPPGIVSKMTSNVSQRIQIRFTKLKMEDDLISLKIVDDLNKIVNGR